MTTEQINRRFAELSEISWHELDDFKFGAYFCSCRHQSPTREMLASHIKKLNPDYCADPRLVLEVMRGKLDVVYYSFMRHLANHAPNTEPSNVLIWITKNYLLDKTGQLALLAIRWMEEKK